MISLENDFIKVSTIFVHEDTSTDREDICVLRNI